MMATIHTSERQQELLKTVRRGEEFVLGAITTAAGAVQSITPMLPVVHVPFAGKLPRAEDVVNSTYDFAELLLAEQRRFAEGVLKAAAPHAPHAPAAGSAHAPKARPATK
jgi:hypothetical protein